MKNLVKKIILIMALVLIIATVSTGIVSATTTFKIGHCCHSDNPVNIALEKFAEIVEEKTNGEIDVQIFTDSQLGDALTQIEGVKLGSVDMFVGGIGWLGQFEKDYNIMATAFVMKDIQHMDKVIRGEIGQKLAEKLKIKSGLHVIDASWHRPPRSLMTVNKKVYSPEDVKGLKLRVPDLPTYTEPWKLMGAKTTPISWGEIYLALQQGICDSMEGYLLDLYTSSLYEPCNYITLTEHEFEDVVLIMSEKGFNKLSAEQQEIIMEANKEARAINNKLHEKSDAIYKQKLEEAGIEFIVPDKDAFIKKGKEICPILEEKGLWSKGLYDEIKALAE